MSQTETIDNNVCRMITCLAYRYGVKHIVISPGTRSAPLVVALVRSGRFITHTVIDERCAAFMALGMSISSRLPVLLVCTSGSALMNYAPALSEAYYRHIPVIAVAADRPERWIDQLDSQTMRQPGALHAVVRRSVDIPAAADCDRDLFDKANREVNEAFDAALGGCQGPVHINVHIDLPPRDCDLRFAPGFIETFRPSADLSSFGPVLKEIEGKRTVVIYSDAGSHAGCELKNIPLLGEAQIKSESKHYLIGTFDRRLDHAPHPDIIITMGGSIVSARLKKWLRNLSGTEHIHVGLENHIPDTFGKISRRIGCHPAEFLAALSGIKGDSIFAKDWDSFCKHAEEETHTLVESNPLLCMIAEITSHFDGDIHCSNGSAIRYLQICGTSGVFCNRGISGIDGCTSTALGHALAGERPVMLITGDMSFAYDIGALGATEAPSSFRIAVLDNAGGDIFRNITTTSQLPERDTYFVVKPNLPLSKLCNAYGYEYSEYDCDVPDPRILDEFIAPCDKPRLLRIIINPNHSKNLL